MTCLLRGAGRKVPAALSRSAYLPDFNPSFSFSRLDFDDDLEGDSKFLR